MDGEFEPSQSAGNRTPVFVPCRKLDRLGRRGYPPGSHPARRASQRVSKSGASLCGRLLCIRANS